MNKVTLVMPYYENPGMLLEHWRLLEKLPQQIKDYVSVVIVDDGSPDNPACPPDRDLGISLQMYRIKQDVRWNQDAARNIGVKHATTEWLLLTDMDHIVPEGTWRAVLTEKWERNVPYRFSRVNSPDMSFKKYHPNSWLISKQLYEKVGGYDERFAGLYGTDGDFKIRLTALTGLEPKVITPYIIRVPREVIPDASTTRYERKQDYDRPSIVKITKQRAQENDPRPRRFLFDYERVA